MRPSLDVATAGALAALLVAGCSGAPAPERVHLARHAPLAPLAAATEPLALGGGRGVLTVVPAEEGTDVRVRQAIPKGSWSHAASPLVWEHHAPFSTSIPAHGSPRQPALAIAGVDYAWRDADVLGGPDQLEPGQFTLDLGLLFVNTGDGAAPPADAVLEQWVERGAEAGGRRRVDIGTYAGEGLVLLPGLREEVVVDLPPDSALRFATAVRMRSQALPADEQVATFRVWLDGQPLHESRLRHGHGETCRWQTVELPAGGRRRARLAFEMDGVPATGAVLAPVVGPAALARTELGEPARPDLVLFVADTFRADLVGALGGMPGLTPELDALAASGAAFRNARSTSSWTLPAHASLFTGLLPPQHGTLSHTSPVASELVTLAEHLAALGWRTGAVTDGGWVSAKWGFDQGFEWYRQYQGELADSLDLVETFLDGDDGRPVFLFVHTFRTHTPYRTTPKARHKLEDRAPVRREWDDWIAFLASRGWEWNTIEPVPEPLHEAVEALRAHYLGAAVDLDREFGQLRDRLRKRGLGDAALVFTSDHGESFLEHGVWGHGGEVYEDTIRVPLIVTGPGVAPRVSDVPASLLDLPRTFAELAGVAPHPGWLGRSLLALDESRPVFAFSGEERDLAAVVDGSHKWILRPERSGRSGRSGRGGRSGGAATLGPDGIVAAFDLEADPGETGGESADEPPPWVREGLERLAPLLDVVVQPMAGPGAVEMDQATEAQLRALGYVD